MKDRNEIRELAEGADLLLNSKAFTRAILDLRQAWFRELMGTPVGSLTATALHAKLQALEAIPTELQTFINDETMTAQRK